MGRTNAEGSDSPLIAAVRDLPTMWLGAEDVERIRSAMGRGVYPPDAVVAMRELLCGIHELCIEIDRSHERNALLEGLAEAVRETFTPTVGQHGYSKLFTAMDALELWGQERGNG